MPDDSATHPVTQVPRLHCGACGSPLLFPRKVSITKEEVLEDDKAAERLLAECNRCCVAVMVPVSAVRPLRPFHCDKVEARPTRPGPDAA